MAKETYEAKDYVRASAQIKEVWIYEKEKLRLFFKDGEFKKNTGS